MIRLIYSGQFRDPSGYGKAARDYLKALDLFISRNPDKLELRVNVIRFDVESNITPEQEALVRKYEFADDEARGEWLRPGGHVFIGHHTPDSIRGQRDNLRLMQGAAKIINMTVWETTRLPKHWIDKTIESGVSAFIVPCRWNEKVFFDDTGVKTYLLPHVIDTSKEPRKGAKKIIPDVFNILTVSQWIFRKGFDALIKAYLMEFCHGEPVTLIIKSYRSNTTQPEQDIIKGEIEDLRRDVFIAPAVNSNAKIYFIGGLLSRDEMDALYSGCDLFALTSRGEGFGLPYTEAIAHGKPVLCPDAGWHVDFIDGNAAYRVSGSFEPCHTQGMFYTSNMDWFEPSVKSIRQQLRRAFDDWQDGCIDANGAGCLEYVKSGGYDYETIGNRFYEILEEVCR